LTETLTQTQTETVTPPPVTKTVKETVTETVTGTPTVPVTGLPEFPEFTKKYSGMELNVCDNLGWTVSEHEYDFLDEFEELTGIKVNMIAIGSSEIRQKEFLELSTGTGAYDVVRFPYGDLPSFAPYLQPLDEYVDATYGLDTYKNALLAGALKVATYNGHLMILPFQGGSQALYYRKNLFENPDYKQAFKNRFGYPLQIPWNYQTWIDVNKFFIEDVDEVEYGILHPGGVNHGTAILFNGMVYTSMMGGGAGPTGDPRFGAYVMPDYRCSWSEKYPVFRRLFTDMAQFIVDELYTWEIQPTEIIGKNQTELNEWFEAGQAAGICSYCHDFWMEYQFDEEVTSITGPIESALFPLRYNSQGVGAPGAWGFALVKNEKDPDRMAAGWEYIKWVTSKRMFMRRYNLGKTKFYGAFIGLYKDVSEWAINEGLMPSGIYDTWNAPNVYFGPMGLPTSIQITPELRNAFQRLIAQEVSVDEFVSGLADTINQINAEAGLIKD